MVLVLAPFANERWLISHSTRFNDIGPGGVQPIMTRTHF